MTMRNAGGSDVRVEGLRMRQPGEGVEAAFLLDRKTGVRA